MPALRTFADQPDESSDIAAVVRQCIQGLRSGLAPTRRLDARVTTVLDAIDTSDDLRMSLDQAADKACLSATRFAHLFKEQVGLPFSRYMLWRKLTRAMVAIASEGTIAAAAHAADFADAAHLTRTFYQMVGMAPSVLMRGDSSRSHRRSTRYRAPPRDLGHAVMHAAQRLVPRSSPSTSTMRTFITSLAPGENSTCAPSQMNCVGETAISNSFPLPSYSNQRSAASQVTVTTCLWPLLSVS